MINSKFPEFLVQMYITDSSHSVHIQSQAKYFGKSWCFPESSLELLNVARSMCYRNVIFTDI